jgi:hypothetical protein
LRSNNLDSIAELYTEDDFRQLVAAIEATPISFGSFGELEDHGERGETPPDDCAARVTG